MTLVPLLENNIYKKKDNKKILLFNYHNPHGVILINDKALEILKSCDGSNSVDVIARKFRVRKELLEEFLENLEECNIISYRNKVKKICNEKILHCWLHVTNSCNLNCRYCYINKSNCDMNFNDAKNIIDRLVETSLERKINQIELSFSGGEPLLKLDLISNIINYCKKKDGVSFSYRILTNGILINNNVIKLIKNNNIDIRISLDGIGKYNDRNRYYYDKRGSYKDVIDSISFLLENDIVPTVNVVITNENICGLTKLTKKLIGLNVPFRFSLEKSNNSNAPSLVDRESYVLWKLIRSLKIIIKGYKNRIFTNNFNVDDICFNNSSSKNCGVGRNILAIGSNGDVSLCGMNLCKPISNIYKCNNAIDMIFSNEISYFDINKLDECCNCMWKMVCNNGCPLNNYNLYGSFYKKNCYCKIYKKIIPWLFKIEIAKK